MRGSDWHHRRSRRVRAPHRHCPCNGVLLCRACHSWAHLNPEEARATGFVVSQWIDEPMSVPQLRTDGWWLATCSGDMEPLTAAAVGIDPHGDLFVAL